jgi:membrane-bound lytic murein transglycosylase D
MRRVSRLLAVVIGAVLLQVTALQAGELNSDSFPSTSSQSPIPLLPGLSTQVEFWKQIFGTYSTRQVVIHDALHLDRVYKVLDFEPLSESMLSDAEITAYAQEKVRAEKERIRGILARLHQAGADTNNLSPEEHKIWALFSDVSDPNRFLDAAAEDRIRSQTGLRERFAAGVEVSRRYLPEMEAIFRREGLPIELTRLPLVESCFNVRAYSKVGAAGIWQFMPSTARSYMRLNRAVDERRDPVISTKAAAEHLHRNYEVLRSWPLAITAYNHGRAGIANAVATVGSSDLMEIIRHYHGPAFKFASRNFYAEFLAAVEVEKNASTYFGGLSPARPQRADTVVLPDAVTIRTAARAINAKVDTLADLNPALTRDVVSGQLRIPKGYSLRIPPGSGGSFKVQYASIATEEKLQPEKQVQGKHRVPKVQYVKHQVKAGQTLDGIAKRHGTTVAAIRRQNNLRANRLRPGQSLRIPTA